MFLEIWSANKYNLEERFILGTERERERWSNLVLFKNVLLPLLKNGPWSTYFSFSSSSSSFPLPKRNHSARGNQFPLTFSASRRQRGISMSRIDSFTILPFPLSPVPVKAFLYFARLRSRSRKAFLRHRSKSWHVYSRPRFPTLLQDGGTTKRTREFVRHG